LHAWVVTRYDDVVACLHDAGLSSNRSAMLRELADDPELKPFFDFISDRISFNDPPRQTRLRALVNKAFTPHAVESMAPRIAELVAELLDATTGRETMDFVRDFADPLPGTVICELLGLPAADLSRFKKWSDEFLLFFGQAPAHVSREDYRRAARSVRDQTLYLRELLPRLREGPGLLCALERVHEDDGDRLSESELNATAQTLVFAGHESTTNVLAAGLLALLRHPDQAQQLCAEPSLLPQAIEEILRYDGPAQFVQRQALEEFEIRGQRLHQGDLVALVLAAANRDPEHFPDPDRFLITRSPNHHLAFGQGPHACPGMPLARLETRVAFEGLLPLLPRMRLIPGELSYQPSFNPRGLKSLPVRLLQD
jgi:cytochrome P450